MIRLDLGVRIPTPEDIRRRERASLDRVPSTLLTAMATRLYSVMNLAWGYVDTVCLLCRQARTFRREVRRVRDLKLEYDRFRAHYDGAFERREREMGEGFEEYFSADFDRMFNAIDSDLRRLGLTPGEHTLAVAVNQAMTLCSAAMEYARWCDGQLRSYGAWVGADCVLVQKEFIAAARMLPAFAENTVAACEKTRRICSGIIVNRLHAVEVVGT